MNSGVIVHESEQVAWEHLPGEDSEKPRHVGLGVRWFTSHGMGGALSRKLRRGGSAESGFISLEVQLLGILSILDMDWWVPLLSYKQGNCL